MKIPWFITGLLLVSNLFADHDLVVYGGTSAGVTAAVQMAREGKTAIIIELSQHVGGLTSGGLGRTDSGNKRVIGGMSREFYQRLQKHYSKDDSWKNQKKEEYSGYSAKSDAIWGFEPKVAEMVYRQMLSEAGVEVVYGQRLNRESGVKKNAGRIVSITMESGRSFAGKIFMDATYEGDLLAAAGVTYHVGREPNSKYGETLNGVQTRRARSHQFMDGVDGWVKKGDPSSGLLPGIMAGGPGEEGEGDKKVQAYCFRMCLTDDPKNCVAFPKPEGYEPMRYELYLRYIQAGWRRVWGNHKPMPNRKTDTNNHGGFSTDNIGMNWDYPEASYARRAEIIKEHEVYQKGLFWFLCNDPRVPEDLRSKIDVWGLAKDEFTDNDNWPHQLYIREARRMVSDYVNSELDCFRKRETPESIGMGSYNMDSHNVQRYIDEKGNVKNEGDVQVSPGGPYQISYRAIRPKREECTNLIVPVCLSSSHIAYGSIRMEPVFMILGQSGSVAASIAIDDGIAVQDVPYEKLKPRLVALKQVLEYSGPVRSPNVTLIESEKLPGIVVDDLDATFSGFVAKSRSTSPFVDEGYRHDGKKKEEKQVARFVPELPRDGRYEVRVIYPALENRSQKVPVTVKRDGEVLEVVTIDQTQIGIKDGLGLLLGEFEFTKGKSAEVEISNEGGGGYVVVDAVQFIPVKTEPKKGVFYPLFNGEDLAGWWGCGTEDPSKWMALSEEELNAKKAKSLEDIAKHWKVEDRVIVNDGSGLYLTTERNYSDFELKLEYKHGKNADSGIYLRGIPQVQIWDIKRKHADAHKGSGGLWNNRVGSKGRDPLIIADKPLGQWNKVLVRMIGNKVTVILNDKIVVKEAPLQNYFNKGGPLPEKGPIQLQTHGAEISWRNIEIKEL
ncbi:FAD-dependent oxidoreductase [Akkermansiaceae bacterium]|nr:FAD-dependent oxidoreductase [Akkermansiaceae bacterium]